MSNKENLQEEVVPGLDKTDYLQERLNPQPGEPFYLHLSDLKLALDTVFPSMKGNILDYGCGGSPYRSLFKDSTYHRADFPGIPDLDFEYGEDSILPVKDETYDFVLSTQVLEHVRIPSRYLNEARRVLRPKGKIVLTTHGFFEEHGAPYDYHRWTAEGLCDALRRSGFEVDQILKLTTGARALLFLWRRFQHLVVTGKNSRATFPLSIAKRLLRLDPAGVDRFCDTNFHSSRMVDGADNAHALYIAVMIVAHRP